MRLVDLEVDISVCSVSNLSMFLPRSLNKGFRVLIEKPSAELLFTRLAYFFHF